MYAIFEDGGRQYKVTEGQQVVLDLKDLDENQDEVTFDKVLVVGEGENAKIGQPWVNGASVTAKVLREVRLPKVTGYKFKRRKGYMKKMGHKQPALRVEISSIKG